ncbi:MAG: hypothetical protein FWG82_02375 [Oscillospiraceae bacterium]|nr:hypothetical protein [Oscillospiraceae bacterium]
MVKGVNKQVLELSTPLGTYFERVLFFVKPEFSATSEDEVQERARFIADSAGLPPAMKLRKNKRRAVLAIVGAALGGLVVGAGGMLMMIT